MDLMYQYLCSVYTLEAIVKGHPRSLGMKGCGSVNQEISLDL